jgi:hypothetical protein
MFRLVCAIQLLLDLLQNSSRNVVSDVLGIGRKEPDLPIVKSKLIDHPKPTAFASTAAGPAQLADATCAPYDIAGFRVERQRKLQGSKLVI